MPSLVFPFACSSETPDNTFALVKADAHCDILPCGSYLDEDEEISPEEIQEICNADGSVTAAETRSYCSKMRAASS